MSFWDPRLNLKGSAALSKLLLRFGRSLSRLRSQHMERVKKDAKRCIKQNLKGLNHKGLNFRASTQWMAWADLKPIMEFLL